jgi:adenine/guanine phosphoribosyltransferase-like PRPP-binding protein
MALDFLRNEFLAEARVIDAEKGYISVPSFNLRMKPRVLKEAAKAIVDQYKKDKITVIHGIPHSGNYLATAVAVELGGDIRLHSSRKDQNIPSAWKDVYREEVRSFTTSSAGVDVFSGINLSFVKKGDRALVLDDVCARGETGYKIVKGLRDRGVIVVGFAVLFDKVFQGGLELISSLGIKVFSCVRVKMINKLNQLVLWTG